MSWTLTYFIPGGGSVTKDFGAWKLSKLVKEVELFAVDKCTFTAPAQLVDADLLFAKRAWVTINRPDGSIYFKGIVGKTPRRASGQSETVQYEIWGPWYWLERLPFQQEWYSTNGLISTLITTTKSRIIVGQNIDGTKMDLGQMMTTVLNYVLAAAEAYVDPATNLAAPFVPFQIGLMTPDTTTPFVEIKDMACASLIKEMAKFVPSCGEYVDYSTTPPTMHFAQRAARAAVAIPILSPGTKCTGWDIDSRDELRISAVLAKYEETNVIDEASFDTLIVDKYPLTAPDNGFHSLVTTVDLVGGRAAYQKQPVTVKDRPMAWDSPLAMNWVLKKLPWLNGDALASPAIPAYDTAHIAVNDLTSTLDPNDPAATLPPTGFSMAALTEELITGDICDWMNDNDGVFAATVKVSVKLVYTGSDPATMALFVWDPVNQVTTLPGAGYLVKDITIKATNAATQTYEELTDFTQGEPVPVDLAQKLYNELSVLHYDGHIETTEQPECSGWITLGNVFNTTDGRAEWRTMNAAIHTITENVERGITTVKLGPPRTLNLQEYNELLRAMRGILPSWHLDSRTNAQTAGMKVIGGKHTPHTHVDSAPIPPTPALPFPFQVLCRPNPADSTGNTFQAKVELNSSLYSSFDLYNYIPIIGLGAWFPLNADDTIWIFCGVSEGIASGPNINSYGQGDTDYFPGPTNPRMGGEIEGTPQTAFRKVIAISVADANGKPSIQQKVNTHLVIKNTFQFNVAALYPSSI